MSKKKKGSRFLSAALTGFFFLAALALIYRFSIRQTYPVQPEVPQSVDVVVVGSGLAGSVTALAAAESGADVLYLDLTGQGQGFPAFSPAFWAAGTPYQEQASLVEYGPPEMAAEITARGLESGLAQILSEESAASLSWLEEVGGRAFAMLPDPQSSPGLHLPLQGEENLSIVAAAAQRRASTMLAGWLKHVRPLEILQNRGQVSGIKFRDQLAGEVVVHCRAVVLADGGVAGDLALLEKNTGISGVVPRPEGGHTGIGLSLGQAAGAAVNNMGAARLVPVFLPEGRQFSPAEWPAAMFLSAKGTRLSLADNPPSAIREAGGTVYLVLSGETAPRSKGLVIFEDLPLLAQGLGIGEEVLKDAIGGSPPPYQAGVLGLLALTPGGLATNADFAVTGADGNVIAGLFAAGEIVSGLPGIPDLALAAEVISGRIAGREAARMAVR